MKMISAVDTNWGIGVNGDLLERIPEDLKYFREKTLGEIVVYVRKTLETFPNKRPLSDRINIVLSSNTDYRVENAIVMHSINELLSYLRVFNSNNIYVIGGQHVYTQLLPYCDTIYITKIHKSYNADAYFPNLDNQYNWKVDERSDIKTYNSISYEFITYRNIVGIINER